MTLLQELKRRNVFKVGAAYLVVAWLVLQLVAVVAPILALPEWFARTVLVLLVIGFPFALLFAWAYELTPEGIKRTGDVDPQASITPSTGQKLNLLIIGVLVLVVVLLVVDNYILEDTTFLTQAAALHPGAPMDAAVETGITAIPNKSIAVLPFANLSDEAAQEYFADGLSEELLNRLARIQDLQVAGRTSSFYFKDRSASMQQIGQQLGVAHILEGSVRKAGNAVRVSAQLIRADNGFQLWSASYDRNLEDIFQIQDEIAEAVITALSVTLSAGEFDRPGMTTNVQAFEAWLHAGSSENFEVDRTLAAIAHLETAVAIDPQFGLAWNALYRAYEFGTISLPPDQSAGYAELAVAALARAEQLMPESPDYLVSSALSQRRMGNFVAAEDLFVAALTRYGNSDAQANLNYAELLWSVGRVRDAMVYLQRAKRLDPKQVDIATRLAASLLALGQTEAARAETQRGIAVDPQNGFITSMPGLILFVEGNYQAAVTGLVDPPPGSPFAIMKLTLEKFLAGDQAGASEGLRIYAETQVYAPVIATMLSPTAALIGDDELALSILSGSANDNINDVFGSFPIWQNFFSGMRALDGFKDLAARSGLVDYWRTSNNWGDFCRPRPGNDDFECF
jgi:TolB-like protein